MAAHEQENERVVAVHEWLIGSGRHPRGWQDLSSNRVLAALSSLFGAEQIGQPTGRDRNEPAQWVVGQTVGWPGTRSGKERLLGGVFGYVEVPVTSDQRAEDPRRQPAQQVR
jgi:hypothetical protein